MDKVFHEKDLTPRGPGACTPPGGVALGALPNKS